jgi:hypothetical protein
MKTGTRFSVFAFISTLVLSIVAISPPARAVSVTFDQVSWAGNGTFQDQNSQWGQANVSFTAADTNSLTSDGMGGYYGFVNIVTSVAGGSNDNWAVQNMPVYYNSLADLSGSLPISTSFDLGQTDGSAVSSLDYSFTLSSTALFTEPGSSLTTVGVGSDTLTEGDQTDPNGAGDLADLPASDYAGAPGGATVRRGGNIATPQNNVPVVMEATNGCAPGAAARSIRYLGNMFPSLNVTQSAQGIYGTLTNYMGWTTNGTSMVGTNGLETSSPFAMGKNAYFASNNLSIASTTFTGGFGAFQSGISSLNATSDLEVWITYGYTLSNAPGGRIITNYNGAHAAFVTGITPIYGGPGGTNIIQYNVTFINDPDQGASTNRGNELDSMVVFPGGITTQYGPTVMNAGIFGFFVETATVPEPSSITMAALGLGLLGLSLVFRKPKRRRT